jgi:2-polyprenyl-6-methoxyphenol hydroxylase-like FAD-dependent oxidoreductase
MLLPLGNAAHRRRTGPRRVGHRAVVLGASMSGLLAARVLADFYDHVTVVERDVLTGDGAVRRGVPQGGHAHVLLPRGGAILDELFPGLLGRLRDEGVPTSTNLDRLHFELNGHLFSQEPREIDARYEASRPFLESRVLAAVRDLPAVTVLDGFDVLSPAWDARASRVVGARVARRAAPAMEGDLDADLVVVATGRNGRVAAWLSERGYAPPEEEHLRVDLMYASQHLRFPTGAPIDVNAVLIGPTASRPRGMAAFVQENGVWIVTMGGFGGHHPPTDREGWLAFADTVAPRALAHALRTAESVDGIRAYRFPANLRRRYDKLRRFPDGLLVIGDAVCSFNPVYGQGMTIAGLEALALRRALDGGTRALAPRFFKAAARPVAKAWQLATGGDLTMPESIVPGPRPFPVRAGNAFIDRYLAAAEHDSVMAEHFLRVTGFDEPMRVLFGPDSLRRLAADGWRHRHRVPAGSAPAAAR